jgi:hypothetical protein
MVVNWIARQFDAAGRLHGDWCVVGVIGGMAGTSSGAGYVSVTDRSNGIQTVRLSGAMTLSLKESFYVCTYYTLQNEGGQHD